MANSPPKSKGHNSHLLGHVRLGDEIEVWWPYDREYYPGKIAAELPNGRHRIHYEDSEIEELELSTEQWRFRGDAANRVSRSLIPIDDAPPLDVPSPDDGPPLQGWNEGESGASVVDGGGERVRKRNLIKEEEEDDPIQVEDGYGMNGINKADDDDDDIPVMKAASEKRSKVASGLRKTIAKKRRTSESDASRPGKPEPRLIGSSSASKPSVKKSVPGRSGTSKVLGIKTSANSGTNPVISTNVAPEKRMRPVIPKLAVGMVTQVKGNASKGTQGKSVFAAVSPVKGTVIAVKGSGHKVGVGKSAVGKITTMRVTSAKSNNSKAVSSESQVATLSGSKGVGVKEITPKPVLIKPAPSSSPSVAKNSGGKVLGVKLHVNKSPAPILPRPKNLRPAGASTIAIRPRSSVSGRERSPLTARPGQSPKNRGGGVVPTKARSQGGNNVTARNTSQMLSSTSTKTVGQQQVLKGNATLHKTGSSAEITGNDRPVGTGSESVTRPGVRKGDGRLSSGSLQRRSTAGNGSTRKPTKVADLEVPMPARRAAKELTQVRRRPVSEGTKRDTIHKSDIDQETPRRASALEGIALAKQPMSAQRNDVSNQQRAPTKLPVGSPGERTRKPETPRNSLVLQKSASRTSGSSGREGLSEKAIASSVDGARLGANRTTRSKDGTVVSQDARRLHLSENGAQRSNDVNEEDNAGFPRIPRRPIQVRGAKPLGNRVPDKAATPIDRESMVTPSRVATNEKPSGNFDRDRVKGLSKKSGPESRVLSAKAEPKCSSSSPSNGRLALRSVLTTNKHQGTRSDLTNGSAPKIRNYDQNSSQLGHIAIASGRAEDAPSSAGDESCKNLGNSSLPVTESSAAKIFDAVAARASPNYKDNNHLQKGARRASDKGSMGTRSAVEIGIAPHTPNSNVNNSSSSRAVLVRAGQGNVEHGRSGQPKTYSVLGKRRKEVSATVSKRQKTPISADQDDKVLLEKDGARRAPPPQSNPTVKSPPSAFPGRVATFGGAAAPDANTSITVPDAPALRSDSGDARNASLSGSEQVIALQGSQKSASQMQHCEVNRKMASLIGLANPAKPETIPSHGKKSVEMEVCNANIALREPKLFPVSAGLQATERVAIHSLVGEPVTKRPRTPNVQMTPVQESVQRVPPAGLARDLQYMQGHVRFTNADGEQDGPQDDSGTLELSEAQALQLTTAVRRAAALKQNSTSSQQPIVGPQLHFAAHTAGPTNSNTNISKSNALHKSLGQRPNPGLISSADTNRARITSQVVLTKQRIGHASTTPNSVIATPGRRLSTNDSQSIQPAGQASSQSLPHGAQLTPTGIFPVSQRPMSNPLSLPPAAPSSIANAETPASAAGPSEHAGQRAGQNTANRARVTGRSAQIGERGPASFPLEALMKSITESNNRALQRGLMTISNRLAANHNKTDERLNKISVDLSSYAQQTVRLSSGQDVLTKALEQSVSKSSLISAVSALTSKIMHTVRTQIHEAAEKSRNAISQEFHETLKGATEPLASAIEKNTEVIKDLKIGLSETIATAITEALGKALSFDNAPRRSMTHSVVSAGQDGNHVAVRPRLPDDKMAEYENVALKARVLTAEAIMQWMVLGGARDKAPQNERQVAVTIEWVVDICKFGLSAVIQKLETFESHLEALAGLRKGIDNSHRFELEWLVSGPTEDNLRRARRNYGRWDPKLLEFEWESDKRVLLHMAKEVLKSEKVLLAQRQRIRDPLICSIRCVQITRLRLNGTGGW